METVHHREYDGIPIGFSIRGSINNEYIYRVRRGNGHYNSKAGALYQDKYAYFVPSSINNAASAGRRIQWAAAVNEWKTILTPAEKKAYNDRAVKGLHMSGYNLFMREAMKGEYHMFVDRGDPAAFDFDVNDFTTDETWRDLDLSGIVPAGAIAVLLGIEVQSNKIGDMIRMREKGNSNEINVCGGETLRVNELWHCGGIIACDTDRVIQYNGDNATWATINVVVRGWWT